MNVYYDYLLFTVPVIGIKTLLTVYDLATYRLPNMGTYSLLGIGLLQGYYHHTLPNCVTGAITGSLVLTIIRTIGTLIFKRDTLGIGDIKLAAGLGGYFGMTHILWTLYWSFILGGLIGIGYRYGLQKDTNKEYLPFGPLIIAASCGVWIWR